MQTSLTLPITCCILAATFICAAPEQSASPVAEIQAILRAQQGAWNRGDIDGFMNGYARSPSTVFVADDEVRRGWETVRERYRQKYSDRTKMGALAFSDVEIGAMTAHSRAFCMDERKSRVLEAMRVLHTVRKSSAE